MNYTVGIDSGSTATKGILLADGVIVRRFLCPTPFRPADAIHEAWETLRAGLTETPFLTLTGYGRQLVDFADKQVTEISCHGLGARLLSPDTRTVIDIGGQDSKVIQLDAGGNLSDFLMNDKCAAGTGRFLEVISRTLGASVEQLDAITDGVEPHAITSMCTVFAESEVISLRSAGVAPEAILAGVINAMARRSANFIGRLSAQGPLLFTGGVSHCAAFARMLESHVGMAVTTHPDAQFAGAIGAALIGVTPGFLLTGIPFGFMALIGLLSLSGMLIRNGIVLVEEIEQQKQEKDQRQAIIDAATSRLRPILLTAFTTVLGLAPLLRDVFFQSMAVVIMFGLAFATVLTLLVLPVIYACFHHKDMTPQR